MAERVRPAEQDGAVAPRPSTGGLYFGKPNTSVQFFSSGCKTLDLVLSGGWARRRISNIVGDRSTGKTLLAIEAAANFVKSEPKGRVRYREAESAFDELYAKALGFPVDKVDFGDPIETVEDLFEDLTKVIEKAKSPELYIVDSLDALSDRAEMERNIDEGTYGAGKAKQMSQLFRRLVKPLAAHDVTVMIISQVRDNIGNMFNKVSRSGGRALDFYASQVLMLSQLGKRERTVSGIKRVTGIDIRARCEKNKVGLAYGEACFPISFGYGVDDIESCLMWLKESKSLKRIGLPDALTPAKEQDKAIYNLLDDMIDMSNDKFVEKTAVIHAAVEKRWFEIENTFLPTRQKYS